MSSAVMPSRKYAFLNTCCILSTELYHQLIPSKGGGLGLKMKTRDEGKHHTDTKYSSRISSELYCTYPDCSTRYIQFRQKLKPDLRRISHLLWYHFVRIPSPKPSLTPWLKSEDFNFFQLQITAANTCILIC